MRLREMIQPKRSFIKAPGFWRHFVSDLCLSVLMGRCLSVVRSNEGEPMKRQLTDYLCGSSIATVCPTGDKYPKIEHRTSVTARFPILESAVVYIGRNRTG